MYNDDTDDSPLGNSFGGKKKTNNEPTQRRRRRRRPYTAHFDTTSSTTTNSRSHTEPRTHTSRPASKHTRPTIGGNGDGVIDI